MTYKTFTSEALSAIANGDTLSGTERPERRLDVLPQHPNIEAVVALTV